MFTNFVAQFPTNSLAPLAQWWIADYFFRLGGANFADAEKNYELVYQNFSPTNELAYPARIMAGRAAVGRQDYNGAIYNYFIKVEGDTNCPMNLRVQAAFAHGDALMLMDSAKTNDPLANFSAATNVFASIIQLNPTNESAALAWLEMGKCELQLTNYDAATNAYAQVLSTNSPVNAAAGVSLRGEAQIGFGIALEKMAALATGTNQTNLLRMALEDHYLEVFDTWTGKNLRDGEAADEFWVKKAGLQAIPLIETLGTGDPDAFIDQMEKLFPQSRNSLEKKRATLPRRKN
jgi:tetratricopeptide (TPR) repeat protein